MYKIITKMVDYHKNTVLFCVYITSVCGFLFSCSSLPDVGRAVDLMEQGESRKAQVELLQLSNFGDPLAKLKLADLYVKIGSEEADKLAEDLYKEILLRDKRAYSRLAKLYRRKVLNGQDEYFSKAVNLFTVSADLGSNKSLADLTHLYLSYPQHLNSDIPIDQWIKQRVKMGDIRANYDLARLYIIRGHIVKNNQDILALCEPLIPSVAECFDVLAQAYRIMQNHDSMSALNTDLISAYRKKFVTPWFVYQYAQALTHDDDPFIELAMTLYFEIAVAYPKAHMAMARLIVRNKQLASKEELLALIKERAEAGVPEAHYLLGRLYFHGDWVFQNPQKAVSHLELVSDAFPGAGFILGLIYKEGWLGSSDFDLALEYLLQAAREGSISADRELAEMYWDQKGIKRNVIYAYSFARLSSQEGSEGAKQLLSEILQEVPIDTQISGEKQLQRELEVRTEFLNQKNRRIELELDSQLVVQ